MYLHVSGLLCRPIPIIAGRQHKVRDSLYHSRLDHDPLPDRKIENLDGSLADAKWRLQLKL
jgi:hypothetical protein